MPTKQSAKRSTKAPPKTSSGWFEVDREGLAKLCERRGKVFVVHELVANAWDTGAKKVNVTLTMLPGALTAKLLVEDDDPDGFRDLTHAYTLFAESEKKPDAEKRGRFNLGEKLVLALCSSAKVTSTTGCVSFSSNGKRELKGDRREAGSLFEAVVSMTKNEFDEVCAAVPAMIPPEGVLTTFNGEELVRRKPSKIVDASLHTEIADSQGILRRTERKTKVEIYEPLPGEKASIYEMGIPVVETGDKYHVSIAQKVPLTVERDNVLPAYLRDVRAVVLNAMAEKLTGEDAAEGWVAAALEDETVAEEAVASALTARFGEKRVGADPSDREAEDRAKGAGYTVIPSGAFSKAAWKNIKAHGGVQPAGRLFPTQRDGATDNERGPRKLVHHSEWTAGMKTVAAHAIELGRRLINKEIVVQVANEPSWGVLGTWLKIGTVLTFNVGRLGKAWFSADNRPAINELVLHEMAHDCEGGENHLSDAYHDEAFRLGAALAEVYATDPAFQNILKGAEAKAA